MLKQRIITALILAPIVLAGLFWLEAPAFAWFVAGIVMLGGWEWANFAGISGQRGRVFYAIVVGVALYAAAVIPVAWVLAAAGAWWLFSLFLVAGYPDRFVAWRSPRMVALAGLLVLVPFWKALVFVRSGEFSVAGEISTLWIILYMLLLVWAADIGAYFAGKTWGKKKLAPRVSPGKSWAGVWGGMASVVVLAVVAGMLMELNAVALLQWALLSAVTAVFSVYGDLMESLLKRHRGIKDSSQLLPGHGGVMDRIDSLTAAIPVFVSLLLVSGWLV